ncbi:MAG: DUF4340 domain-containing protein [Verrucomicrobiota bacterium]|nr:DUF4340 domain-containing protein [Verrucomicrobiota bacterium]
MTRKQLIILLVLVVALGGAALLHFREQSASWSSAANTAMGKKLLGDGFQVNDVAQIQIRRGTNELDLSNTNGRWRVRQRADYPAAFSQISSLLLKLQGLKIVQTLQVAPSQRPELDLAAGQGTNAATVVELCDAGGRPLRALWLGKNHVAQGAQASPEGEPEAWPDGRYVLTGSNSTTVAVISDPLSELNTQPNSWLDKTFFKIAKPRSIAVEYPKATNSWQLVRSSETGAWKLADAKPDEKLDASQASEVADALSSPSFNDVAVGLTPAQTGLDDPTRVEIKTFDGFDYAMNVGRQTNDNDYFTVRVSGGFPQKRTPGEDEKPEQTKALDAAFQANLNKLRDQLARESAFSNWVYLVPNWTLDPLLKKRSQLLVAKPATPETNAVPARAVSAAAASKK